MSSANRRLTRSYAVADLSKPEPPATEQPRPVPKKRRQPPKSATTAATSAITPPEAEVAERECPLSGHAVETNKDDQPPVKKSKVANSEADIRSPSSPVTPLPGKQNRPKPVLRTLPDRKRNPHPGAIVMNHPRRTSAQVAADKKRAEELKQSLEELAQKKVEILAEIEVQQQTDDAEEERRVVKRLEDLGVSAEEFSDHSGDTEVDEGVAKLDSGDSSGEDTDQTRATPLKVTVCYFPEINFSIDWLTTKCRERRSLVEERHEQQSMPQKTRSKGKRESCLLTRTKQGEIDHRSTINCTCI